MPLANVQALREEILLRMIDLGNLSQVPGHLRAGSSRNTNWCFPCCENKKGRRELPPSATAPDPERQRDSWPQGCGID